MQKHYIGCSVLLVVLMTGCGGGKGGSGVLDTTPKTVNLSWTANRESTVNAPGGGYRVYYSATSGFAPGGAGVAVIDVPHVSGTRAAPTSTSVELPPGTYYFRVVAYSAFGGGAESAPSSQMKFFVY